MNTASSVVKQHLFENSFRKYILAEQSYKLEKYNECINYSYEVIEFSWKYLYLTSNKKFPKIHFPSKKLFDESISKIGFLSKWEVHKMRKTLLEMNPIWEPTPKFWLESRYFTTIIDSNRAYHYLLRSKYWLEKTLKTSRMINFKKNIKIGILNGFYNPLNQEKKCNDYKYSDKDFFSENELKKCKSKNSNFSPISINEISTDLNIVINPFGEIYPDLIDKENVLPGFMKILEYVNMGGLFINFGGQPFYYFWDVITGKSHETIKSIPGIPHEGYLINDALFFNTFNLIPDTLLKRYFDADTTMGLNIGQNAPYRIRLFQKDIDKKIIHFSLNKNLHIFRSLIPGKNILPVLRARINKKEVFPIGFINKGAGKLLHIGISGNNPNQEESVFIKEVIRGVINSYRNLSIRRNFLKIFN